MFNRNFFDKQVQIQFNITRRQRGVFSLLFIDIDSLKSINDSYGHTVGGRVIGRTAKILKAALRKSDIITRIGGDKFIAILPDATLTQARLTAAKIEKRIKDAPLAGDGHRPRLKFSVSIGVFAHADTCPSVDQLIREADARMYARKNAKKQISQALGEKK